MSTDHTSAAEPASSVEQSMRESLRSLAAETDDEENEEPGVPPRQSYPRASVEPSQRSSAADSDDGEPDPLVLMWAAEQKAKRTAPPPKLERSVSKVL